MAFSQDFAPQNIACIAQIDEINFAIHLRRHLTHQTEEIRFSALKAAVDGTVASQL